MIKFILRSCLTFVLILNALIFCSFNADGQVTHGPFHLNWNTASVYKDTSAVKQILAFDGSVRDDRSGLLPVFSRLLDRTSDHDSIIGVTILDPVYETLPAVQYPHPRDLELLAREPLIFHELSVSRKHVSHRISIIPLRKNSTTGDIELLKSFAISIDFAGARKSAKLKSNSAYAPSSVLAKGAWYKIAVGTDGIYKIGYEELKAMGIDPASVNPKNLRIYGNGGGMLPEANSKPRIDDLRENPVFVSGEDDGRFDPGDYLLFYGESPHVWTYKSTDQLYHHINNVYSEQTCYFLNFDQGAGKRIADDPLTGLPATTVITTFEDYTVYEKDEVNLIKSGREWWDHQYFDVTTTRNYSFSFPNIDSQKPVTLTTHLAARSTGGGSSFAVTAQGNQLMLVNIPGISGNFDDDFAKEAVASAVFSTSNPVIDVKLTYNKSSSSSVGYLNYIELNASRLLIMNGSQMAFRTSQGLGTAAVSEFNLTTGGQSLQIWDVTDGGDIRRIPATQGSNVYKFKVQTSVIREFIAFDGSSFLTPSFIRRIENQDLHATQAAEYIIIAHPSFVSEAERLAQFHLQQSNLTAFITTPEKIYNEFSSGAQDITAIRDFIRMLYENAETGKEPRYLLFFGDASYDYKDRTQNNTNMVPSFESVNSLSPIYSFIADDYFGKLDPNEGQSANGILDIGIGRFPIATVDEAKAAVDKVIHYASNSQRVKNDWRNILTFVADDQNEGNNLYINDSEELAKLIETKHKAYNVDKIYSDAYTMVSTPGGARYPEVNEVINKRVEKGSLIMNYIGHGGELGWAHERILEVPDIKAWKNFDNMPVFVTATCEFSRYDDPERVSAGEWVFLNPYGGGVSLFTTTRLTFAGTNKTLLDRFYAYLFVKNDGRFPRMGDLLRETKDSLGNSSNIHSFCLLGDPALQIAYPELNVVTRSIKTTDNPMAPDTLKALAVISVTGEVLNSDGMRATDFNGTVLPTVFDKASEIWTKANYGYDDPVQFFLRKNAIYKGKVEVTAGQFSFSFIVPKDIAYQYGVGKISFYARSAETDAQGYDENIQVGGYNNDAPYDDEGPELALYINDRNFVSGGITNQKPTLLADVSDSSGINMVGNGIGHDITAILDNKTTIPLILNDYYVSDLNTFKSGVITYPFSELSDGPHTVTMKVWDVYNNSTQSTIEFIVVPSAEFAFQHLFNYPNPMRDQTTFSWETNQVDQMLDMEVRIYTLTGMLIKVIREQVPSVGYRNVGIQWNGTQDDGRKISSGTYVYQVSMTIPDGTVKRLSSKLVVIR